MSVELWILLIILGLAGVGAWLYMRQKNPPAPVEDNRYAIEEAISPAHISLLMYLREAFPGRAVLFRPRMDQIVAVRHSENRQMALEQLSDHYVDFVVCDRDGKAEFAFDVRMRTANIDENQQRRETAFKSQIFKSVGLRLMRIQRSVSKLPPPEEFAPRLLQSLGRERDPVASYYVKPGSTPLAGNSPAPASQPAAAASAPAAQAARRPGSAPATEPAGLTEIMGLPPATEPGKLDK